MKLRHVSSLLLVPSIIVFSAPALANVTTVQGNAYPSAQEACAYAKQQAQRQVEGGGGYRTGAVVTGFSQCSCQRQDRSDSVVAYECSVDVYYNPQG